jgi:hypothetical protein
LLFTVAILVLLEDQVTFLFVASVGAIVAVRVSDIVPQVPRPSVVLFSDTPVTGFAARVTVTVQVAVLLPS